MIHINKKKNDKRIVVGVSCNKRELVKVDKLCDIYRYKFRPKVFKQLLKEKDISYTEEHKILKQGVVDMTKLMHKNRKYFNYDRDELELLIVMYHDILEHVNEFIMEARDE